MSQIIHARFEDGVPKPEDPLDLPPNARVGLVVVPMSDLGPESFAAWREIERLWGDVDIDSGSPPPSRDELHDRH
jgi:predicted DNA-binding antitoxin AbrB/MazE fold protein